MTRVQGSCFTIVRKRNLSIAVSTALKDRNWKLLIRELKKELGVKFGSCRKNKVSKQRAALSFTLRERLESDLSILVSIDKSELEKSIDKLKKNREFLGRWSSRIFIVFPKKMDNFDIIIRSFQSI